MKSSNRPSQDREHKSRKRDGQPAEFDKSAFAARVRGRMDEIGVSGAELARRSNVPSSNMGRYLDGESGPKAEYIVPLSDALDVSIRWLLTGEGPMERSDKRPPPSADQEAWLVADYRLLPEGNRIVLKAVLDAMLGRLIDTDHPLMRGGDPAISSASVHAAKTSYRPKGDQ